MRMLQLRLRVRDDGTFDARVPSDLAPGEYEAVIVISEKEQRTKPSMKDFPVDHGPWDDSISLRREDMYGDDGR